MKRFLILLVGLLFCVCGEMHAQIYNVTVKNQDGNSLDGVLVYSFKFKKYADAAFEDIKKGNEIEQRTHHYIDFKETQKNGSCNIQCTREGYIVLYDNLDGWGLYSLYDCKVDENFAVVLRLDVKTKSATPRDVVVTGKKTKRDPEDFPPIAHGNEVTIPIEFDINAIHAKEDARVCASPKFIFPEYRGPIVFHDLPVMIKDVRIEGNDTVYVDTIVRRNDTIYVQDSVVYMPPVVVDGMSYKKSMLRRMSFVENRDKLHLYNYDSGVKLQNHQGERILTMQKIERPKGTKYYVPGVVWYEDFNGVYYQEEKLFNDGKETEPMRFLDWDNVRNSVDINRKRYVIEGTLTSENKNESFPLKFEVGSRRLNLKDSITIAQRDRMMSWISMYDQQNVVQKIVIRGYSSPEGLEKSNRQLSRDRANTIKDMLKANFAGYPIVPEYDDNDNIVPWEVVADTMLLMNDSVAQRYAIQLRDLIKETKGIDAQNRLIYNKSDLYKYLKDNVLERVRRVDIEVEVVVQRILTKEEIVAAYSSDTLFRRGMKDYQYYIMLSHLADENKWNELRQLAKEAVKRCEKWPVLKWVTDPNSEKHTITRPDQVPYPLASYYYAVATMRCGMVDTTILKPFLDEGDVDRLENKRYTPMNDLSIIVAQALMYCQAENYNKALDLLGKYRLSKNSAVKRIIIFIKCLAGEYLENDSVRAVVEESSPLNKAVMCQAMGKYKEALNILYGDSVNGEDANVLYLKAICRFRENKERCSPNIESYSANSVYSAQGDDYHLGEDAQAFAYPMFEAFKKNENFVKYLENDGYFNDAYRQMLRYFWKRYNDGVPMSTIAKEYTALVNLMREQKSLKN